MTENHVCRTKTAISKIVLDTNTGVYYNSATEAAYYYNIKPLVLMGYLRGERKNKTSLIYV